MCKINTNFNKVFVNMYLSLARIKFSMNNFIKESVQEIKFKFDILLQD